MTTTTPFDPSRFLQHMHGVSFAKVGVFMLIRSHMLLSPDFCMTRQGIHAALRTRSAHAIDLVASVIDDLFETDDQGFIFSQDPHGHIGRSK